MSESGTAITTSSGNCDSSLSYSFWFIDAKKFWILSFLTCGIYPCYWSYKQWKHFRDRALDGNEMYPSDKLIKPIWCLIFVVFYLIGTARRVRDKAKNFQIPKSSTGPWWAFWLAMFSGSLASIIQPSENLALNFIRFELVIVGILIQTWQYVRIQRKANKVLIREGFVPSSEQLKYTFVDGLLIAFGVCAWIVTAALNITITTSGAGL